MTPKELFDKNQKLVGFAFKKYIGNYSLSDYEDVIQEGMLGLWQAAVRFDESKGVKFNTFAMKYIYGYMLRYIRAERNMIRVPRAVRDAGDSDTINKILNVYSLDAEKQVDDNKSTSLIDTIADLPDDYEYITEEIIDKFLDTIENPIHRDIMEEYYYTTVWYGKITQRDLYEKYGISQPNLSRILKRYNDEFAAYINNN